VVTGLLERGYEVSILHRGRHEDERVPAQVEHLHADPYDAASLAEALAGRRFEVAIASYGRLRSVVEALVGVAGHIVAIGGLPVYRGFVEPALNFPRGLPTPVRETFARTSDREENDRSRRIARAEDAFFAGVQRGDYTGSLLRYPYVYGRAQPRPREWSIIRRIQDGRSSLLLPDGGLTLFSHGYADNLVHAVLLVVDQPELATGEAFNVGDDEVLTLRQWVEVIAHTMGAEMEIVGTPDLPGHPGTAICSYLPSSHRFASTQKIRQRLGYADLVPVPEALARTVHWYLEHPVSRDVEESLQDPFDYAWEDQCLEIVREMTAALARAFEGRAVAALPSYS
jgi:nucleoside-diphosphate-sugar epimerase